MHFMPQNEAQNHFNATQTRKCPSCGLEVKYEVTVCPQDGTPLVQSVEQDGSLKHKFQFIKTIGSGGMGVIYQARQLALNKIVAVKMLHPHLLSPNSWRRFQVEGRAATALSHPNLISVLDMDVTPSGLPYIVMDYVSGITLQDWLAANGAMPVPRAMKILIQVAAGLAHAHSRSVLHRDIKPSNVMLIKTDDGSERALVLDFGIAKFLDQDEQGEAAHLTRTGETIGSPQYMSPEQARGAHVDQRADIYSFGCVMFELLTGQPPFCGKTAMETMLMHLNDVPPELSSRGKNFAPELDQIVGKALNKDPDLRFASMDDLRNELVSLQARSGRGLGRFNFAFAQPKKINRSLIVAIVLGFLIAVAVLFSISQPGKQFLVQHATNLARAYDARQRQNSLLQKIQSGSKEVDLSQRALGFKVRDEDLSSVKSDDLVITDLILSDSDITDNGLLVFKSAPLTRLLLDGTKVQELSAVKAKDSVLQLSVSGTPLTNIGVKTISTLDNIRDLDLSYTNISDIKDLRHCLTLQKLNLQNCANVSLKDVSDLRAKLDPECVISTTSGEDYQSRATAQYAQHNYKSAAELADLAAKSFWAAAQYDLYSKAILMRADSFRDLGDFGSSANILLDGIRKIESLSPQSPLLTDMYFHHGLVYYMGKDYVRSAQSYEKAAGILRKLHDTSFLAGTYIALARDYLELGKFDEALHCARQARELDCYKNNALLDGCSQAVFGEIYRRMQRPQDAVPYLLKAIKLYKRDANIQGSLERMHAELELCQAYSSLKRFSEGESLMRQQLKESAPALWRKRRLEQLAGFLNVQGKFEELKQCQDEIAKLGPG
jgi:serine/threonine protein kinase